MDLVTDYQLLNAEALVQEKFAEAWEILVAMDIELPPTGMIGLAECMKPSAESVETECERLQRLYLATIDDVPIDVDLKLAENDLDGWQGEAATEFKRRLAAIGSVHEQQKLLLAEATLQSAALLGLIKAIRRSYLDLATETVAALDAAMGRTDKRQSKMFIAMGSDLVRDVLSMDPTKLLTGSIGMVVGVAKNLVDYLIEGSEYDEILEKHRTGGAKIAAEFTAGQDYLAAETAVHLKAVLTMRTPLGEPLPVTADIHSPTFDYHHFAHQAMPVAEYQPRVAAEKKRMTEAREAQQSEIDRRLGDLS